MRKFILLIFFLIITLQVKAEVTSVCSLNNPSQILVFPQAKAEHFFSWFSGNCSSDFKLNLLEIVKTGEGKLDLRAMAQRFHAQVQLKSPQMNILQLEKFVHEKMNMEDNFHLFNLKSLNSKSFAVLSSDSVIELSPLDPQRMGNKQLAISIYSPNNKGKDTLWFSGTLKKNIKGFIAKNTLTFQDKISRNDFQETTIWTDTPQDILTDMNNIHFYRPTRNISKGTVLSNNAIISRQLVAPGKPVKILFQSGGLKIEAMGIARQSGSINQTVELYNPKNNKRIYGTVTGEHQVRVKL